MDGQPMMWIVAAIALAAVLVVGGWYLRRRRRSDALRSQFGPEYDRTIRQIGDVDRAEAALAARAQRVERLGIRPLTSADQRRFSDAWQGVQEKFVDDPKEAIRDASRLVDEIMNARGYPVGDFEQRVDDVSVDHPGVVMNYRAAREIAEAQEHGQATTEDLRQAMIHYRALYQDLLDLSQPVANAGVDNIRELVRGQR